MKTLATAVVLAAATTGSADTSLYEATFTDRFELDANGYVASSDEGVTVSMSAEDGVGVFAVTIDDDGLGEEGWFGAGAQAWFEATPGALSPAQLRLTAELSVPEDGPTGPATLAFKDETTGTTWTFRADLTDQPTLIGGTLDTAKADNPAPLTADGDYSIFVQFADAPWGGWSGAAEATNTILIDNVKLEVLDEPAAALAALRTGPVTQVAEQQPMPTYGPWHQSRLGGGGFWMNVIPSSDPDIFYTFSDVGGAWRSTDGGKSWRSLNADLGDIDAGSYVRSLSVDPRDPDTLLMSSGSQWYAIGGLYRSTDAGQTWDQVVEAPAMGNEETRMAGLTLDRQPGNPDRIVYSHATGVKFSTDNGGTWTDAAGDFDALMPGVVMFDSANPDRVWVGGRNDQAFVGGWSPDGPRSFTGGLWRSDDGGETFTQLSDLQVVELAHHPDDGSLYAVTGYEKLQRSTDGGQTWQPAHDGLPTGDASNPINPGRFQALTPTADALLTLNGRGEIFRLDAPGESWTALPTPSVTDADRWYGHVPGEETAPGAHQGWVHFGKCAASLTVDPHDPQRWFLTDWYAVWRSEDAGASWALSIDGLENTVSHDFAGQPDDPDVVHWAMGDNGYLRSADGGRTFAKVDFPAGGSNVKDFAQSPADPQRLYATTNHTPGIWETGKLAVSRDAGETWTMAKLDGLPADLGDTRFANSVSAHPDNADRLYLAVSGDIGPDAGGVYESDDAGDTWTWIGSGLPNDDAGGDDGFFKREIWAYGNEVALGHDGAVAYSYERKTVHRRSGSQWVEVDADFGGGQPYEVVADPHTPGRFWLAVNDAGLYRSDDNGQTWVRAWEGDAYYVSLGHGKVAVGHGTGIAVSADDGETWTEVAGDVPVRRRLIPAFAGSRLHAGTHNMGSFWRELP